MKTLVLMTLCLLSHAQAASIVFTFSGTGTGTLGTVPFSNAPFTITANADTQDASDVDVYVRQILVESAMVRVDGFGTDQFEIELRLFHSPYVSYPPGPGGQTVGLSLATGPDLLDLSHQLFVGYDLVTTLGPVFVPTPNFQSRLSFNNIPTSGGPMTLLSSANVTFTAQLVPEPSPIGLFVAGVAVIGLARLARKSNPKHGSNVSQRRLPPVAYAYVRQTLHE